MAVVSAPRVVAGGRVLAPGAVVVERGRIAAVLDARPGPAPDHLVLDRGVLAPGLVDLQVNGCFGVDLADADPAGWERVVQGLPATGVTSFLSTFISAPLEALVAAIGRAAPGLRRRARRAPGSSACTWKGRSCRSAGAAPTTPPTWSTRPPSGSSGCWRAALACFGS
jgi:N-acetylglucosamine-6-phosphate deacetylase